MVSKCEMRSTEQLAAANPSATPTKSNKRLGKHTHWLTTFLQAMLLMVLANFAQAAGNLTATVDRNKIGIDETLNLRLRYTGDESGGQPDFELLEQDFDILSRQQSNQYRVINGHAESFVEWMLTLAPKREGNLFVPSLHYKGEVSDAIPVIVTEAGSGPGADNRQAFLEVELDKERLYVQEQLLVKVRLYTTIGLHDIATEPLQIPGAHIEKVDEQRYERRINGVAHAVYELTYAVFPESSGELTIPALNYVAIAGRRDPFSLFNRNSQRLRLRSQPKTIEVQPKPDTYSGTHWLPAASLGIVQSWSQDPKTFTVGEPITRIVTLRAEGLRAAQLPPLPKLNVEGLKTYPDQPQQDDQADLNGITGSRTETTAIVATKPGDYQLPPITLTWWDTKTGRQRATQLPAFRFTVSGSATATMPQQPGATPDLIPGATATTAAPSVIQSNFWRNLAIAALASHLLWLLYFLRRRSVQPVNSNATKKQPNANQQARNLEKAAETGDPATIQQATLKWLRARWPEISASGLEEANRQLGFEELEKLQGLLDAALYATPPKPLNRQQVVILVGRLLKRERSRELNREIDKPLPDLFA
ncbi:BatD family protein [Microbulbifer thermotolerans]|uniref:BatD family protein n=2 Tax=Microbulbifer thermotolerans TaxID=252514 RepID=UPI00224AD3A4|nr:BatD family protein [Microbulbifer thermotolerans]MCX2779817.1 BatD family protein [Microbulbifer thermotolerans]MCX2805011.1 BatD family protein [Microbulbifer thermotolerans]